jgi:putative DNA primase/helicase
MHSECKADSLPECGVGALPVGGGAPDLTALLDRLSAKLSRHLMLPAHAADAIALWILFSHSHKWAQFSPILALVSPQKRCGKTTSMNLIGQLVPRPRQTANITSAALYRVIEAESPTLLIDEADTFLDLHRELLGVLNSGHNRSSAFVMRADSKAPGGVSTLTVWCPKVIAMIGTLRSTLEDRSIKIPLFRKARCEHVERFNPFSDCEVSNLREGAASWASSCGNIVETSDPEIPQELNDRAADNWRGLLAIADAAGAEWAERARRAAVALSFSEHHEDHGQLALTDIRQIFENRGGDRIRSIDLVADMAQIEHRPWAEWVHLRPISPTQLSSLLSPYGIRPTTLRIGSGTAKGYYFEDFRDAFSRYVPQTPA